MPMNADQRQRGLSLIEMMIVMMVLVTTSTILIRSTAQISHDQRYEKTIERHHTIRRAIVDTDVHPTGALHRSFVTDIGRPPYVLRELIDGCQSVSARADDPPGTGCLPHKTRQTRCLEIRPQNEPLCLSDEVGWAGPYLTVEREATHADDTAPMPGSTSEPPINGWDAYTDGWGNEWPYTAMTSAYAHPYQTSDITPYVYSISETGWLTYQGFDTRLNYGWAYTYLAMAYSSCPGCALLFSYGNGCLMDTSLCVNEESPTLDYEKGYPLAACAAGEACGHAGLDPMTPTNPNVLLRLTHWAYDAGASGITLQLDLKSLPATTEWHSAMCVYFGETATGTNCSFTLANQTADQCQNKLGGALGENGCRITLTDGERLESTRYCQLRGGAWTNGSCSGTSLPMPIALTLFYHQEGNIQTACVDQAITPDGHRDLSSVDYNRAAPEVTLYPPAGTALILPVGTFGYSVHAGPCNNSGSAPVGSLFPLEHPRVVSTHLLEPNLTRLTLTWSAY